MEKYVIPRIQWLLFCLLSVTGMQAQEAFEVSEPESGSNGRAGPVDVHHEEFTTTCRRPADSRPETAVLAKHIEQHEHREWRLFQ